MRSEIGKTSTTSASGALDRRTLLRSVAMAGAAATGVAAPLNLADAEAWEEGDIQCRPSVQEKDPDTYKIDDALLLDFMKASETLTGVESLDTKLGLQYLERYARHPDLQKLLPPLIAAHKAATSGAASKADALKALKEKIKQDPTTVGPAAEQLVYLWYVSAFFLPIDHAAASRSWLFGTAEQYERSLLWSVVYAHPPMTRGGNYGYWADAPHV